MTALKMGNNPRPNHGVRNSFRGGSGYAMRGSKRASGSRSCYFSSLGERLLENGSVLDQAFVTGTAYHIVANPDDLIGLYEAATRITKTPDAYALTEEQAIHNLLLRAVLVIAATEGKEAFTRKLAMHRASTDGRTVLAELGALARKEPRNGGLRTATFVLRILGHFDRSAHYLQ
jgi:hypothetical protein